VKKLIDNPSEVVRDALRGLELAHPGLLRVSYSPNFVVRADAPVPGKVALISGGGSGHEPLHTGYVGPGMLDAACPGEVFTSPTPDQIYAATGAVHGGAGVLFVVKNYTGDVLNFEMAQELAIAEGIQVESVLVDDDVAVLDSLYTAGRRGVGGTVFVEKIAGAKAEAGAGLAEVKAVAERVVANVRSLGLALTSCTVPAVGHPTFALGEDEMELGIGIHGEPGRERVPLRPAAAVAELLFGPVVDDLRLVAGEEVAVLINGMGGTPLIELYVLAGTVGRLLVERQLRLATCLVGTYITSLEMAGCSLTVLRLDPELKALLAAPANTLAWPTWRPVAQGSWG
jgi:phosphoenolpyruvate---glycerone phosphotransferase subunit DhaK